MEQTWGGREQEKLYTQNGEIVLVGMCEGKPKIMEI